MNRFTRGLIAGGIIGAIGTMMAAGDRKTKKQLLKKGKKIASGTENLIDDVRHKMW